VADQGKRNVSHGCINISPANAKWFFDNFGSGDPIVVTNSVGTQKPDGANDWQI
jgi:lipoprotein-anchoring transpeptidase ErfK/SrfK